MLSRKSAGFILSLGMVAFALGAEEPTTKPTVKLIQPWDKVSSLSSEQREKIHDIHEKSLDDMKAIRDKEKADIMALLTDDQKADLKKNHAEDLADKKMSKAEKTKDSEK